MSIPNPLTPQFRIRGVLFDLDGTLYRQGPVRSLMAAELLTLFTREPVDAVRRVRALRLYRHAQERLRASENGGGLAAAQLAAAAEGSGLSVEDVSRLVDEWMLERPLKYVRRWRAPGLDRLLNLLERAQVRLGVLSDYPPDRKLRALGLDGKFAPVLCTTDSSIDAFKPHPRGFLRACHEWRLPPKEVLVIGDRLDVDAAGASAAGMPCVIIGRRARTHHNHCLIVPSFERLCRVLERRN